MASPANPKVRFRRGMRLARAPARCSFFRHVVERASAATYSREPRGGRSRGASRRARRPAARDGEEPAVAPPARPSCARVRTGRRACGDGGSSRAAAAARRELARAACRATCDGGSVASRGGRERRWRASRPPSPGDGGSAARRSRSRRSGPPYTPRRARRPGVAWTWSHVRAARDATQERRRPLLSNLRVPQRAASRDICRPLLRRPVAGGDGLSPEWCSRPRSAHPRVRARRARRDAARARKSDRAREAPPRSSQLAEYDLFAPQASKRRRGRRSRDSPRGGERRARADGPSGRCSARARREERAARGVAHLLAAARRACGRRLAA